MTKTNECKIRNQYQDRSKAKVSNSKHKSKTKSSHSDRRKQKKPPNTTQTNGNSSKTSRKSYFNQKGLVKNTTENMKAKKNYKINILQINLHKEISAMAELENRLYSEKPEVVCIQEPRVIDSKIQLSAPGYELFKIEDKRVRSAILVKKELKALLREDLCSRDSVTVVIETRKNKIYVTSTYWDSNIEEIPPQLKNVTKTAKKDKAELIICGDFNAWSTLWSEKSTNKRGEALEDFLISQNLFLENIGNTKTYKGKGENEGTIIDLTITNAKTHKNVTKWSVDNKESCFRP